MPPKINEKKSLNSGESNFAHNCTLANGILSAKFDCPVAATILHF